MIVRTGPRDWEAGPAAAMVGGAALLAVLASGTGTAALVLLLARRPRASAAALGVTGAYAGAGALLAREGLDRLRAGSLASGDTTEGTVQDAKKARASAKRSATPTAKSAARSTSRKASAAAKRGATPQARRPADRARRRASQRTS